MAQNEPPSLKLLQKQNLTQAAEIERLKTGGGGGTSGEMLSFKDYVDARDDATESRLSEKLEKLSTKGTIWGAVATGVVITLAVLAFAGDRFDSGLAVSPQIASMQARQASVDARQDAQAKTLDSKMDIIIKQTARP